MKHRDPVIFISEPLSDEQRAELLRAAPSARIVDQAALATDASLAERIDVCYSALPAGLWGKAKGLSWLQVKWAGVDTLLALPQVVAHRATITNVHIHGNAVCEHLWGMTLMLTRNLKRAVIRQEEGRWDESLKDGLATLSGRTLCIVGLGAIGEAAPLSAGRLECALWESGVTRLPAPRRTRLSAPSGGSRSLRNPGSSWSSFPIPGILALSSARRSFPPCEGHSSSTADVDAASIRLPLWMPFARETVRGAGLDVTDPEPLPPGHPLWAMPNVVITPHYAGNHPGYDGEAFSVFVDNLARWVRGEPLRNVVERDAEAGIDGRAPDRREAASSHRHQRVFLRGLGWPCVSPGLPQGGFLSAVLTGVPRGGAELLLLPAARPPDP